MEGVVSLGVNRRGYPSPAGGPTRAETPEFDSSCIMTHLLEERPQEIT
jgi:hypothetical protein